MVLNLHIRFVDMDICTFILLGSLPIAWIAVGCFLLILLLVVTILFILKSREVATLKKQCEDLNETMRMMRYEEANLSRMLHTASKSVERPVAFAAVPEESGPAEQPELAEPIVHTEDPNEVVESDESIEVEETANLEESAIVEEVVAPEEVEVPEAIVEESQQVVEDPEEEVVVPQPHKQAINERRPAIPTDLFAAWFAENEDTVFEDSVAEVEKKEGEAALAGKSEAFVLSQEATPDTKAEIVADVVDTAAVAVTQDVASELSVTEAVVLQGEETVAEVSDADVPVVLNKEDERFCRKLERIVNTRLRNPNLNIDIIAAQFGIGRTNFYRKVRELTGISPNDYLRKCRMERAAELLLSSELPVNDVCAQVGIPDAQYFSRVFKAHFGVSPTVYREQHNQ